jgi:TetR/AcrR family transcriptional repressor of nem operon
MADRQGRRTDVTRQKILRAAAHQFARRPYHQVSVDDIVADAEVTKSAMYSHFRSKDELALAIIEARSAASATAMTDLLAQRLSGLETLVDFCLLVAVEDASQDLARAALNLLEVIERPEGVQAEVLGAWTNALTGIIRRALADGDIQQRCDPNDLARLIVALHIGLQRSSNLDEPERFLRDFEASWILILAGVLRPDGSDYFLQFLRRRVALAVGAATTACPPRERRPTSGKRSASR